MKQTHLTFLTQTSPAGSARTQAGEPLLPDVSSMKIDHDGSSGRIKDGRSHADGEPGAVGRKRVLIVDDETAILLGFKKIIQCSRVEVDTAETVEEALDLLRANDYQFVITDLRLSGSSPDNGFDIIRFAKEKRPGTNVILITGHGTPEVMEKAFSLGAAHYYEKPVSGTMLRDTLIEMGM